MARDRMSSQDLNIERGRFNNPITPKNQQICTRCELNEIDDEIHLLLHCSAMNNEREILYDSVAVFINIQPTNVLKETFSRLASQAGKAIFALRKQSSHVVGKLSPTIAFKVFDCQILPILEYGSDIWYTGDDVNDLEKNPSKIY